MKFQQIAISKLPVPEATPLKHLSGVPTHYTILYKALDCSL